jgi:hypothetical protein
MFQFLDELFFWVQGQPADLLSLLTVLTLHSDQSASYGGGEVCATQMPQATSQLPPDCSKLQFKPFGAGWKAAQPCTQRLHPYQVHNRELHLANIHLVQGTLGAQETRHRHPTLSFSRHCLSIGRLQLR